MFKEIKIILPDDKKKNAAVVFSKEMKKSTVILALKDAIRALESRQ